MLTVTVKDQYFGNSTNTIKKLTAWEVKRVCAEQADTSIDNFECVHIDHDRGIAVVLRFAAKNGEYLKTVEVRVR